MTIGTAIVKHLVANSGVAALVGEQIYPELIPAEASLPAISISEVGSLEYQCLEGGAGLFNTTMQINCWSEVVDTARSVRKAAIAALDGFAGTMGGTGGITVQYVRVIGRRTLPDPQLQQTFNCMFDVEIMHEAET